MGLCVMLECKLSCEILLLLNIWVVVYVFLLHFIFLVLLFRNGERRKVGGEAKGKMHGQLFCSYKTKNHHKLK